MCGGGYNPPDPLNVKTAMAGEFGLIRAFFVETISGCNHNCSSPCDAFGHIERVMPPDEFRGILELIAHWGMRYSTYSRGHVYQPSVVLYGAGDSWYSHFSECKQSLAAMSEHFFLETTITHDYRSWWNLMQKDGLNKHLHTFYRLDTPRDVEEFLAIPCYGDKMTSSRILVDAQTPLDDILFPLLTHGLTVALRSMDKSRSPMTAQECAGILDALGSKLGREVSYDFPDHSAWGLTPVLEGLRNGILMFRTCFNPQSPRHEIKIKSPTQVEEDMISHILRDVFGCTNIDYRDHRRLYTDWCPRMGCETKGVWYFECSAARGPDDYRPWPPHRGSKCRKDVA